MLSQKLREEKMVENSTIRMMLALGEEEKVNSKTISERKKRLILLRRRKQKLQVNLKRKWNRCYQVTTLECNGSQV